MAERIEVLFGMETHADPMHIVLDEGPHPYGDGERSGAKFCPMYSIGTVCSFDAAFAKLLWPRLL